MTPKLIRLHGHVYRLATEPVDAPVEPPRPAGPLPSPGSQLSTSGKTLKLKSEILDLLFDLGVGQKVGEGVGWTTAPAFLPINASTSLATLLNIVNNYVLHAGEGNMPQQTSDRVLVVLHDAQEVVENKLKPRLAELKSLFDQFVAGIPDLGYGMPSRSHAPVASTQVALYNTKVKFHGATYKRLWHDLRTAGLQRLFEAASIEDVEQILDMVDDFYKLQDLYHFLHTSISKSVRSINTALSTFFTQVAAVTSNRSRITDRSLSIAMDLVPTLLEQLDAAGRVLKRVVAMEKEFNVEAQEIHARDMARMDEGARREFAEDELRAKGRGRPRKVRPEEEVPSVQDM